MICFMTRQDRANEIVKTWIERSKTRVITRKSHEKSYQRALLLEALGSNPEPNKVEEIIEDPECTWALCSVCGTFVDEAVFINDEYSEEPHAVNICRDCANKLVAMFV